MKISCLKQANATKLEELNIIISEQANSSILCPITMKGISIDYGSVETICNSIASLTKAKKVLMVSDSTDILDAKGRNVKESVLHLLKEKYETQWFILTEPDSIVHATPENAAKIQAHFEGVDCIVGVGSGSICDLCKYATYFYNQENPIPLVIVQTALSVNAFSDNSSVMLINGVKRTVHSRYPDILIIDLNIVSAAPYEMNVSGYGDLIATWTAPVDWYLGYILGMNENFHTAPSEMIRIQCEELLENSEKLAACDGDVIKDLSNVLTLSGLSMGIANESSPASGSEHVMSHLIDMSSTVRNTGICYHGTQVAVSSIISEIIWDWFLTEFDPDRIDINGCYPTLEEMEPKVKAAFDWLDNTHAAANECWNDYQKKLIHWTENKEKFVTFLNQYYKFKIQIASWVKKPEYIAKCMHKANAPTHYSSLNYPVDKDTVIWAITNCHLMRNRFSIIDLLYFSGIWNEQFIQQLLQRADFMDAGL